MEYSGNTNEQETIIEQAVRVTLAKLGYTSPQDPIDAPSLFPLRTAKQVANIFNVSPFTVKVWHHKGLLRGNYQILSGRSCRLVFSNCEVERFFTDNFPSLEDLSDHPCNPRRGGKAARLITAMFKMNALYSRRRQRVEGYQEGPDKEEE